MILHFVKLMGLLRFPKTYYGKVFKNAKRYQVFRGVLNKYKKDKMRFGGSKFDKFPNFQKVDI